MKESIQLPYSVEEVRVALSQMHHVKARGPDGMCPLFFQTYWHIVGPSVSAAVLGILNGAAMPPLV